jgi:DNA-directed RNA polymerase specialized sigma24 family protein
MTARQIIEQLYRSEELRECLSKIKPQDLQDDLLQHCFLELLNKDEAIIINLHLEGRFIAYVAKMMYNMVNWKNSEFNRIKMREVLTNDFNHPSETIEEENLLPLHRLHWVSEKVLTLYAEHGSYRAVGEVTGIPYSTVFRLVKEAKIKIKKLI